MLTTILKIPYLRLKYKFLPNNGQKFWAQELLNSQGLSAKLGQVLGQGKKTELPKSSITVDQAKKIFNREFQKEIIFSGEVHAASMGQVFFIRLDGDQFAIKILHPGIKESIRKEIDNILILGKHFAKSKGFNFEEGVFKRFLTEVFEEETDLKREGQFQKQFLRLFKDDKRFKIPEVFEKYSNESILCQELTLSTLAKDVDKVDHFFIYNFFFESLLNHGVLHGDLNDRNWGISNEGLVVIYDFGCSQIISERRINGFKKLLTNKDIINGFKEFGIRLEATYFKGREQELRDALFNPLLNHEISPSWSISQELQDKYQDKIKSLREYTDPWVLLMMRSLFSLIRFYQSRNISIPLGKILSPYLEIKAQEILSTDIKIEVLEDGKQVVYLTLPISALDNLHNLMPDKVSNKIDESQLDLKEITKRVKDSQFSPQELFSLTIEKRSYKVWIE